MKSDRTCCTTQVRRQLLLIAAIANFLPANVPTHQGFLVIKMLVAMSMRSSVIPRQKSETFIDFRLLTPRFGRPMFSQPEDAILTRYRLARPFHGAVKHFSPCFPAPARPRNLAQVDREAAFDSVVLSSAGPVISLSYRDSFRCPHASTLRAQSRRPPPIPTALSL